MENQTVNPSKGKNTLGVVSLVLAIVAIAGSWIPILNVLSMIVAIVAILLGIWSFINVMIKKSNMIALPIIGVIIAILAIIFSVNMNNEVSKSISGTDESSKVGSSTSQTSEAQQIQSEYNVGDIIAFDNKEVTVTKVEKNYDTGNEFITPKTGNEYIKVSIKIENKSDKVISVNPYDFKIQDSNGAIVSIDSPTYSLDDQFESAELISGGVREESVVFEVSKEDSNLKFIYQPSFWSENQIKVKL